MIRDASLRKVVSADALGAVPAANLQLARFSLCALLLFLLRSQQARLEQRHGTRAVFVLRALVLALDNNSAWDMRDAHGGVRLVDMLPARAGRTISIRA